MVLDFVPLLEPVKSLLGLLGPERVGVFQRAPVHLLILLEAGDMGGLLELGRNVEYFSFKGLVCHNVLRYFPIGTLQSHPSSEGAMATSQNNI